MPYDGLFAPYQTGKMVIREHLIHHEVLFSHLYLMQSGSTLALSMKAFRNIMSHTSALRALTQAFKQLVLTACRISVGLGHVFLYPTYMYIEATAGSTDIGNWGVSIDTSKNWPNITCGVRPSGAPAPCPTPDGSNAFLKYYLGDALLDNGWSVAGGSFAGAKSDWVGTTLMDPSEPFFEDLLLEQLNRRMGSLVPSAQGIAIDRFDYTAYYSYKRDDGISWIPQADGSWGVAQSLVNSHVHTYSRLAAALRAASPTKLMLGNCNTLCRIDIGGLFDGGFSEGAALNAVAWLGLRRPSILWTYSLDGHDSASLDVFFQQHVVMRVFPMAPMPANDHSINPGPLSIQQAYEDYAPIFFALRGAVWVLDAVRPVSSEPNVGQVTNIFRAMGTSTSPVSPGELLIVVALGGNLSSTQVTVSGTTLFQGATMVDASVLVPGASSTWQPLGSLPVTSGGIVVVAGTPMSRGCALLRLVPA